MPFCSKGHQARQIQAYSDRIDRQAEGQCQELQKGTGATSYQKFQLQICPFLFNQEFCRPKKFWLLCFFFIIISE
jgi:hypothetical protein